LNRWPFAHNGERGFFDQSSDTVRFFCASGIAVSTSLLEETRAVIDKRVDALSEEGRIVLLADIVAGFIEDPLWAMIGLDLHPGFIPTEIAAYLCIPLNDKLFLDRILCLNWQLFTTRAVQPFKDGFDDLFAVVSGAFLDHTRVAETLPFGEPAFEFWRTRIKEGFMRTQLFPYNNEKICRGTFIRNTLISPVVARLRSGAVPFLTSIDEERLMQWAASEWLIDASAASDYRADLDYVATHEPEKSFRANLSRL